MFFAGSPASIALFLIWLTLVGAHDAQFPPGPPPHLSLPGPPPPCSPLASSRSPPGDATLAQGQSSLISRLPCQAAPRPPRWIPASQNCSYSHPAPAFHRQKLPGLPLSPTATSPLVPIDDRTFHLAFDGTAITPSPSNPLPIRSPSTAAKQIGQAQSPPYTITIQSRPGIASSMQLAYTFPRLPHPTLPPHRTLARKASSKRLGRNQSPPDPSKPLEPIKTAAASP